MDILESSAKNLSSVEYQLYTEYYYVVRFGTIEDQWSRNLLSYQISVRAVGMLGPRSHVEIS